jgi:hypothetical protein
MTDAPGAERRSTEHAGRARPGARRTRAGWPADFAPLLAMLALGAVLTGRALAPALPGSQAGIDAWIAIAERTGAVLTQTLALLGTAACVRLTVTTLAHGGLSLVYRLLIVPAAAAVVTLVLGAASRRLDPGFAAVLGLASAALALAATPSALASPATRAVGLALGCGGLGALMHLAARTLGLRASEQALASIFATARGVATAGFLLDAAGLAIGVVWLAGRAGSRVAAPLLAAGALVATSGALGWAALGGSLDGARTWQVVAGRALGEMTPHPAPLVLPLLRYAMEVAALLIAACAPFLRRADAPVGSVLALVLLARASTDVPACALLLAVAALLLPLRAAERRGEGVRRSCGERDSLDDGARRAQPPSRNETA